jgi:hypothetical protein
MKFSEQTAKWSAWSKDENGDLIQHWTVCSSRNSDSQGQQFQQRQQGQQPDQIVERPGHESVPLTASQKNTESNELLAEICRILNFQLGSLNKTIEEISNQIKNWNFIAGQEKRPLADVTMAVAAAADDQREELPERESRYGD